MVKSSLSFCAVFLGLMFFSFSSFSQDEHALLLESDKGNVCAMFDLGTFYLTAPEPEIDKAYEWYTAAAEKGHAQAQENLCEMYFYGVGKGKDLDKAMKWCSSAASDERAGAVWKSDFLAITHPETRTAVHMQEWEYGGKTHEIPGKVGGIIPDPSTWNCKSIFVPEEIRAYPPKLENREAQ